MPRSLVAGVALALALGATTILLAVLSPSPLSPDVAALIAARPAGTASEFEVIFATRQPFRPERWNAIYIHHSRTPGGSAATLADAARGRGVVGPPDHFVIGNGNGLGDGVIEVTSRWSDQQWAGSPALGFQVEEGCISICLIGDFDRGRPTEAQRERLRQLVAALRGRLGLGEDEVLQVPQQESAAGIGRYFAP